MARDLTKDFSSQIHFVVHARGDALKAVEPVLLGILAQTEKETELGCRVALRMLEQMEQGTRTLPQSLAILLIRGWLVTENLEFERECVLQMQNSCLSVTSDSVMAACFREALKTKDEYLKSRSFADTRHVRDIAFQNKLVRFIASAEAGCQGETLKVAAYMYLRRCSPAAIVDLFKPLAE